MRVGGLRDDLIKSIKNPIKFTIELIPQISFELKTLPRVDEIPPLCE